jgi:methyl-accepting chemotaxis protein
MAEKYKRRNYFTKKGFQTRFILHFLTAAAVANVVTVAVFVVIARKKIDSLLFSMRLPQAGAGDLLSSAAFVASITAVVAVTLLFLWAAREMHNKIANPLHQVRTDLHKITKGDLHSRVTLREEDEFKFFAEELNTMVDGLNRRFTGLKNQADELAKSAKTLSTSPTEEESRAVRRNMTQAIQSLEEQIRSFKR